MTFLSTRHYAHRTQPGSLSATHCKVHQSGALCDRKTEGRGQGGGDNWTGLDLTEPHTRSRGRLLDWIKHIRRCSPIFPCRDSSNRSVTIDLQLEVKPLQRDRHCGLLDLRKRFHFDKEFPSAFSTFISLTNFVF